MRFCVVGAGPTAEGKGRLIDGCDFVVRIKRFWQDSASNAGSKCNAVATYDAPGEMSEYAHGAEVWITQSPQQMVMRHGANVLEGLAGFADLGVMRWITHAFWELVCSGLQSQPSTGLVAIAMGMQLFSPGTLVIVGFDQLTPADPNFDCARRSVVVLPDGSAQHPFVNEKRALAEIFNGVWLGEPTDTTLRWPDMPELT